MFSNMTILDDILTRKKISFTIRSQIKNFVLILNGFKRLIKLKYKLFFYKPIWLRDITTIILQVFEILIDIKHKNNSEHVFQENLL